MKNNLISFFEEHTENVYFLVRNEPAAAKVNSSEDPSHVSGPHHLGHAIRGGEGDVETSISVHQGRVASVQRDVLGNW